VKNEKVIAVIPSIDGTADELGALHSALASVGIDVHLVANSAVVADRLASAGLPFDSAHQNIGSVTTSANFVTGMNRDWEWLVLANDDLVIDPVMFADSWHTWCARADRAGITYFCHEPPRPIPGRAGTFMSMSLLARGFKGFGRPRPGVPSYQAYTMAVIRRGVWDGLGGVDTTIPFTYEDTDFARRAIDAGVTTQSIENTGVTHGHSVTTSSHVRVVLPVSAWSAVKYLDKWYGGHRWNVATVVLALYVRTVFAVFARADLRDHLAGIRGAIRALRTGHQPSLPPYEGTG